MLETVSALFVDRDRKVLLGLRAVWKRAWPGHWDAIGGRVEPGEALERALIRECREEVGLTPTRYERVLSEAERFPERNGAALHHIYVVSAWEGGPAVNLVDEHDEMVNPLGIKGLGEIGIVGVAAAVGNAIFHATGKRLRDLPFTLDKVMAT